MKNALIDRLCLGTAQFGMDYGIANKSGKASKAEIFSIMGNACENGIDTVDTANSYGDSETAIGEYIKKTNRDLRIISKTPHFGRSGRPDVRAAFRNTLERLQQERIYGYLVHSFDDIKAHGKLMWDDMRSLKDEGLIDKIGVSLYRPEELNYIFDNDFHCDIVQVPYSIFDRRFEDYFTILKDKGAAIYARSIFLQGLSFMSIDEIGKKFPLAMDKIG
ncbi:MAG: aldo/keto reductase, partial [Candidatus Omnitrophota bacterium]